MRSDHDQPRGREHSALETRKREAGPFTFRSLDHPAGQRIRRHAHEPAQLCLVVDGGLEEGHAGDRTELTGSDLVYRSPGAEHENRVSDAGAKCLLLELPRVWLERLTLDRFDGVRARVGGQSRLIAGRLLREWAFRDDLSELVLEALVARIIDRVPSEPIRGRRPPVWMVRAEEYTRARFRGPIRLADLAREAGVHPVTVIRGFRAYHGCTPGEFARELRLLEATSHLVDRRGSLTDAALSAGFYDQSHLTNALREAFGLTPGRLRAATAR